MERFKTFRLPQSSKDQKPSYLIMILDGSGSMTREYHLMINAYKKVFKEMIESKQIYAIQFSDEIGDIEPYLGGGSDIQLALVKALEELNKDIKANITICVVSDGHVSSNINALQQQIDAVKKKYQIQFTSIAVGSGYPFELFQKFRDSFHNGALSCTNVQFVERSDVIGKDQCQKDFINAFEIVRSQLSQKKKVQVIQQVWESITAQPTFIVLEDSVVASLADRLITKDGVDVNETKKATDIAEYIQTSCQEFLKTQSNEKYKDSMEQAKQMKQIAQDLYKRVDQSSSQHKENVNQVLQQVEKDLMILEEISTGKLDLKNLSQADKTKLLSDFNPQKADLQEAKIQEAKLVELTEEQKQEKFQQKLIELLNEKSEIPGHLVIISLMSDLIEEAKEEKKSQKDILEQFLHPKKKSLQTISNFTQKHQTWVEQFIDCYINVQT